MQGEQGAGSREQGAGSKGRSIGRSSHLFLQNPIVKVADENAKPTDGELAPATEPVHPASVMEIQDTGDRRGCWIMSWTI